MNNNNKQYTLLNYLLIKYYILYTIIIIITQLSDSNYLFEGISPLIDLNWKTASSSLEIHNLSIPLFMVNTFTYLFVMIIILDNVKPF